VIRQNLGTIIDTETLKVRLKNRLGGTPLGEVEEASPPPSPPAIPS
jgi:ATP-dependent helicase Lhr and Lhr-like helicase